MEKLICKIQPGLKNQIIYIQSEKYDNKKTLETFSIPLNEIPDFIINQKVYDVYFRGNKDFISKIEKDIKQKEIEKYSENKIIFNYI